MQRKSLLLLGLLACMFRAELLAQSFDEDLQLWRQMKWQQDQQVDVMSTSTSADKVSLNRATAAALQKALDGVGKKKAQAIIDYRQQQGGFRRLEQLQDVPGISQRIFEQNKMRLSF